MRADATITRRRLLQVGAAVAVTVAVGGCRRGNIDEESRVKRSPSGTADASSGRLGARPADPSRTGATGSRTVPTGGRDALVYVPDRLNAGAPAPLAVMLHGAGGTSEHGMHLLAGLADDRGLIVLAPQSHDSTWDVIGAGYGPDVRAIDRALAEVFDQYRVDPAKVAVGGFSDGASYALSLGITNGGLFTHIVAFSPGFNAPGGREGRPDVYVSHGTRDAVLPIDRCSRRIVPALERSGYDVTYHEFDGPHTVPDEIAAEAMAWFLDR